MDIWFGVEATSVDVITSDDQVLFLTTFSRIGNKNSSIPDIAGDITNYRDSGIRNFWDKMVWHISINYFSMNKRGIKMNYDPLQPQPDDVDAEENNSSQLSFIGA